MAGMNMKKMRRSNAVAMSVSLIFLGLALFSVGCASAPKLDFTRFEVGAADAQTVFRTAVEVIRDFYTKVHGGISVTVDEENLMLETGYIVKKTRADFEEPKAKLTTTTETPTRQKLYMRVIPMPEGTDIEFFASYEVLEIDDPDDIKSPDDMWVFVRQDTQMEELLYTRLLEKLLEEGLLD